MGTVQSGKAQVECSLVFISLVFSAHDIVFVSFVLMVFFLFFFARLVHPRYQVLRCLIPAGPMAPAQLLLFCSRTRLHHYRNATILLLEKWALVIGPLLMIPLKLATDCPITTQLLLQALPHHRRRLQMGRSKMTPALSEPVPICSTFIYNKDLVLPSRISTKLGSNFYKIMLLFY